jgi:hypothetical protein
MGLSDDDRKFISKAVEIRDEHIQVLVDNAIAKHKKESLVHNPVKAAGLFASAAIVWEQVRKLWTH